MRHSRIETFACLCSIKSIRKEVNEEVTEGKKRLEKRHVEYEHREKYGTKKFGRYRFEDADLDLNLSEDITGNLRTMKVSRLSDQRSSLSLSLSDL